MNRPTWTALTTAALLYGCSSSLPATAPGTTGAPPSSGSTPVTFVVSIPAGTAANARFPHPRRSRYISPSTQSIQITLGGTTLLTANVAAGSKACKTGDGKSRTCLARTTAPTGTQTFVVTAYDGAGGTGNVLAKGNVPATLQPGSAQRVNVSLTGKPTSIALSLSPAYPLAGKPSTSSVIVSALDADGNTIVGAYAATIALKDIDSSGATKLSASSVADSSTGVTLSYDGSSVYRAVISANAPGLGKATAVFAPAPTNIAQYVAPWLKTRNGLFPMGLSDVCLGPDGNMWITGASSGSIEKVDESGKFTTYKILGSGPVGITVGADKNLWFAESQGGKIASITTGGKITEYALPVPSGGFSQPNDTTLGPDGNIWYVDEGSTATSAAGSAGKITPGGKLTSYPLPPNSGPQSITAGPDGNLWISDGGLNAILVLSTSGKVIATHRLTTPDAAPWGITTGPDKNIWFTEYGANQIGRMTPSGQLKELPVPSANAGPLYITPGPDGNLWFTETGGGFWNFGGRVGYVTTDMQTIREFAGTTTTHVHNLAFDANRNLWYTSFALSFSNVSKMTY
jgi:streptogramin lyase